MASKKKIPFKPVAVPQTAMQDRAAVAPEPIPPRPAPAPAKPTGPRKMPGTLDSDFALALGIPSQPTVVEFRKKMMAALARGDGGSIELFQRAKRELVLQGVQVTPEEVAEASKDVPRHRPGRR